MQVVFHWKLYLGFCAWKNAHFRCRNIVRSGCDVRQSPKPTQFLVFTPLCPPVLKPDLKLNMQTIYDHMSIISCKLLGLKLPQSVLMGTTTHRIVQIKLFCYRSAVTMEGMTMLS